MNNKYIVPFKGHLRKEQVLFLYPKRRKWNGHGTKIKIRKLAVPGF